MPKRTRRRKVKKISEVVAEQRLRLAVENAYQRGLKEGADKERKETQAHMALESLKVRIELGRSFAAVFEGITRSAAMFFDGGANVFKY